MLKQALQETIIATIRPYVRNELPGWGRIYDTFVGSYKRNWLWENSRRRIVRGKLHAYQMTLDISGWADRSTYFLGRWYDLDIQTLSAAALRPGDMVIDIGANRGMFALAASRLVGSTGQVMCFEPNPKCVEILQYDLRVNSITNVSVNNMGLSDESAELLLSIPRVNSGEASFGRSDYSDVDTISTPVKIGDDVLQGLQPSFIKIDVEGYEARVVNGLMKTIQRSRPVIVTEVVERHLQRCGASIDGLVGLMNQLGYKGYHFSTRRKGKDFHLSPVTTIGSEDCDIAWLHPDSAVAHRLRPSIRLPSIS